MSEESKEKVKIDQEAKEADQTPLSSTAEVTSQANGHAGGGAGEKRKRSEKHTLKMNSPQLTPRGISSPRLSSPSWNSQDPNARKIAIAVDLSDESAYALRWAVKNYLRPTDFVVLLHVRPTSVLYGADWGASDAATIAAADKEARKQMEDDFDALTLAKTQELAKPLDEASIAYKTHIVKDHDMKERICLEVERLGVSACIMGSRGFGAAKRSRKARLGSVSDYCVHHCDCPVVVVRLPEEKGEEEEAA